MTVRKERYTPVTPLKVFLISEHDVNGSKGYCKTELDQVKLFLRRFFSESVIKDNVSFVEGYFESSLKKLNVDKIALLHIDVDLYQSYLDVLNNLYTRVVKGGVIFFDDMLRPPKTGLAAQKQLTNFLGKKKSPFNVMT